MRPPYAELRLGSARSAWRRVRLGGREDVATHDLDACVTGQTVVEQGASRYNW